MTIDSQQLRVFRTLAEHLNMSRAAEELEMTPSGISHCLKSLESDLGCRLFERTSRKISVTPAGEILRGDAEAILQRMGTARTKLKSWGDGCSGHLHLAAESMGCLHVLPAVLREFRESFPSFTIRIDHCSTRHAIEALAEDRAGLALIVEPQHSVGMEFIPLAEDELHFLVHPRHPWVTQRKAERDGVAQQKVILPERTSETHRLIQGYFREEGFRIEPLIEIGNEEAIKEFVQLNLGIGLLPRWIAAQELSKGTLVAIPLGRRKLRRCWGILHARSHRLTFPENVFVDLCRNVTRMLMAQQGHVPKKKARA